MSHIVADRRQSRRRHRADEHGIVATRVRPGHRATVVDVSAGGALLETHHRLLPGASVEIHMETVDRRVSIRGRVLRCTVFRLRPSSVCYRGAIGFDWLLPWFVETDGYAIPIADHHSGRPIRAGATPEIV